MTRVPTGCRRGWSTGSACALRPGRTGRRPADAARAGAAAQPAARAPAGLPGARQARAHRPAARPRRPGCCSAGWSPTRWPADRARPLPVAVAARGGATATGPPRPAPARGGAGRDRASRPRRAGPRVRRDRHRRSGHCVAEALGGADYLHSTRRPVPGVDAGGRLRRGALARHRAPAAARRPGAAARRRARWCSSTTSSPPAAPCSTRSPRCTARAPAGALRRGRAGRRARRPTRPARRRRRARSAPGSTSSRWPAARSTLPAGRRSTGPRRCVAELDAAAAPSAQPRPRAEPRPRRPRDAGGAAALGWPAGVPDGGRHGFAAGRPRRARRGAARSWPRALGRRAGRGERTLVLGTEELMYAAAAAGRRRWPTPATTCAFSTTTRSPAVVVDDPGYALRSGLAFPAHDDPADGPGPALRLQRRRPADRRGTTSWSSSTRRPTPPRCAPGCSPALRPAHPAATTAGGHARDARTLPTRCAGRRSAPTPPDEVGWLLNDLSDVALEAPDRGARGGRSRAAARTTPSRCRSRVPADAEYQELFRAGAGRVGGRGSRRPSASSPSWCSPSAAATSCWSRWPAPAPRSAS